MTTELLIFIYFPISIVFLTVVSVLLYRYRIRKEAEFSKCYPELLTEINQGNIVKANEIFDKIQWNSSFGYLSFLSVLDSLDELNTSNHETKLLKEKINIVFDNKGWNTIREM